MAAEPPPWLQPLQAAMTAVLRTPLDATTGTLRATPERYPEAWLRRLSQRGATSTSERTAVYQRQYWFRLFTVLQAELPLTARIAGFWHFNRLAEAYLLAYPPTHVDLHELTGHWQQFVDALGPQQLRAVPLALLRQASAVDLAWQQVFQRPKTAPLVLTTLSLDDLAQLRLRLRPDTALVAQDWPLVQQRLSLPESGEHALPPGERLPSPETWVIQRSPQFDGVQCWQLSADGGRLFGLLEQLPVGDALAQLAAGRDAAGHAALAAEVQHAFGLAHANGWWRAEGDAG